MLYSTATGFEPVRQCANGFQVRLLNHSDKLSSNGINLISLSFYFYLYLRFLTGGPFVGLGNKGGDGFVDSP